MSLVVNTSRSFSHSWFITGVVTRLTRQVPLVENEVPTLPVNLSSPPGFSGVRVTRSLVLCVCFVDRCLSFSTSSFCYCVVCSSSFCHCVVCSSSIYTSSDNTFGIFKLLFISSFNLVIICYIYISIKWIIIGWIDTLYCAHFTKNSHLIWQSSFWCPESALILFCCS